MRRLAWAVTIVIKRRSRHRLGGVPGRDAGGPVTVPPAAPPRPSLADSTAGPGAAAAAAAQSPSLGCTASAIRVSYPGGRPGSGLGLGQSSDRPPPGWFKLVCYDAASDLDAPSLPPARPGRRAGSLLARHRGSTSRSNNLIRVIRLGSGASESARTGPGRGRPVGESLRVRRCHGPSHSA
jgi:hypothetical protein